MALPVFTSGVRVRASQLAALVTELQNLFNDTLKVVKGANSPAKTNNTLAADPDLFLALAASSTYIFRAAIYHNSGTTPDIQFAMAFPASSTITWGGVRLVTTAALTGDADFGVYTAPTSATSAISAAGTASDQLTIIEGTINTSTTPGNLQLYWAQATTTASNTFVLARSSMTAWRVRTAP